MTATDTGARLYFKSRAEFRDRAARSFVSIDPHASLLVSTSNELVAGLSLFASQKNFAAIDHGLYIADLLVSFCRTHFIAAELIAQAELIDAGVLVRKQMELVSRLHELRFSADIKDLVGRTPNVKHLPVNLRRIYDEYSRIAHSSHPDSLVLLGRINANGREYTPLYPVFDRNAYASLSHHGFVVADFARWMMETYRLSFSDYDADRYERLWCEFWLSFQKYHSVDLAQLDGADSVTAKRPRAPGMLPGWSPEVVSRRVAYLALTALFELRRK